MRVVNTQNAPFKDSARSTKMTMLKMLAAASLFILPACADNTASEDANVTTDEIVEETVDYVGEEVTIRADVEAVVDDSSFLIADDDYFDGEGVLVINATTEPFVVPDVGDTNIQVTGKVETFAMSTVADTYNLTLDPELYEAYEAKPVIIAQSLALSPDVGEVAANPELYYNKRIAIEGEVEDVLEAGLFTLDEDNLFADEDLLVIPDADTKAAVDGDTVVVTGVLRPYIKAEFEADYDLEWDLEVEENIEAEYEQKPVFVADSVYPSAI